MNKDALLATLIGFAIGLFITGMLLVGPKILRVLPKITFPSISFTNKQAAPTPAPTPREFRLTIESPLPDSIESDEELLVSGSAEPGSTVVLQGNSNESVVTAQADGKYAGKITLIEGKNDISVTSYKQNKQKYQSVTVFYTPEEF